MKKLYRLTAFGERKIWYVVLLTLLCVAVYAYHGIKNNSTSIAKMYANNDNTALAAGVTDTTYSPTVDPPVGIADNILESNSINAQLGHTVAAAGDINGDGFADAVSGAPFYTNGQNNEGAVFIYYGSTEGISGTPNLVLEANQADANFGYSVSGAVDINKDGYADVIVGAPYYDDGQVDEGAVFIYYGSSSGLQTTPTILQSNMSEALFGFSVAAAGDVDKDGYGDVIIGANWYSDGNYKEGAIYLFKGSSSGIVTTPQNIIKSNQGSALLGYSVSAAGDVNGDGYADVIAGAWLYDNGQTDEGVAFVYYGSASGLNSANRTMLESNQASAAFGYSVSSAGDVNGDGYDDVIVGAFAYDNGQPDEGAAFIFHGSETGISTTYATLLEANQAGAAFGVSVNRLGDINKDGYHDVIVGAFKYDNGETDEGAAFVYYGSTTGINTTPISQAESNQAGAQMALSVAGVGDMNADGYPDVLIGAPMYANGQTKEGAVFAYYNISGAVPQKIYVNATASGSNNGSNWANAFTSLESALAQANNGTDNYNIYVAAGTYTPTNQHGGQPRQATFAVKRAGINLYGGYNAATGSRNVTANISTISGNMDSYKLMGLISIAGISNAAEKITIDGFTIRDAYAELEDADNFSPLTINGVTMPVGRGGAINMVSVQARVEISNCILRSNWTIEGGAIYGYTANQVLLNNTHVLYNAAWNSGAGIASLENSDFTALNCVISGNAAFLGYGGAWYMQKSSAKIYGGLFYSNSIEDDGLGDSPYTNRGGGAIYADNSNIDMVNSTLYYNLSAIHPGAGLHVTNNSTATIANAVFYNNLSGAAERDIYQNTSLVTVNNSIVQSGFAGGTNIFLSAPMFVNSADPDGADNIFGTADDGLRITSPCSPAINGGSNAKVPAMLKTDLVGEPRIQRTTVDMGAYESMLQPASITALYVNAAVANSGDGTSWATAFKTLKEALEIANAGCADSIKVAAGTYYPTGSAAVNDRDASFSFTRDRLKVIGGYNASTGQRNIIASPTILSGDILGPDNSDNSYHIIQITNITGPDSLIIDGFTITKANANGGGKRNQGGGIYASNLNTPTLNIFVRNCTFTYNTANYGAGVATYASSVPTFVNCTFYKNVANYNGGAFHNNNTSGPGIINCVFVANSAVNGGAILNNLNSSPRIRNCTFYANTASGQGGVMHNTASWVSLNNSIVWGNSSVFENTNYSSVSASNSIVQGGYEGDGNLNINPLFVNDTNPGGADGIFGTIDDGLMLQEGSPAIAKGDNSAFPNLNANTKDFAGNTRVYNYAGGGTIDIGAYEYQGMLTPTIAAPDNINKKYDDANFTLIAPISTSNGNFSYAISDANIAHINGSTVSIKGVGTVTITITQAATADYAQGSTSFDFTVDKANTVLSNFPDINKVYGDADFMLPQPTSNSNGTFSYTSSDENVAIISGNTVTIKGAGTVTITASQTAMTNYNSGNTSLVLTVEKANPTLSNFTNINKTFGDADFTLTPPTSNSNGTFSYISSDENVATINGNMVTIKGAGTATITATQAAIINYNSQSINLTLAIEKANQTINFNALDAKTTSSPDFMLTANASSGLEIKYTSTDNNVASVYQDAGVWKVKIKGAGTTYITALQEGNINYNGTSVSQMLMVTEPVLPVALIDYIVKKENNFVRLDWQTATETNNKGFEIYRSGDDGKFVKIGEIAAVRTDRQLSISTYTFTDKQPLNGNNYYKLVQIDNNGKTNDLGVRTVNFSLSQRDAYGTASDILLYPNPVADILAVSFASQAFTQLEVIDLNGKLLQRIAINATENRKQVLLGTYPAGVYIIKLIGKEQTESRKIIKK